MDTKIYRKTFLCKEALVPGDIKVFTQGKETQVFLVGEPQSIVLKQNGEKYSLVTMIEGDRKKSCIETIKDQIEIVKESYKQLCPKGAVPLELVYKYLMLYFGPRSEFSYFIIMEEYPQLNLMLMQVSYLIG